MKCGKCKTEITGRNFGVFDAGTFVDICSERCRAEYNQAARWRRSADAGSGVPVRKASPPRKLSPSEIRKRSRPKETDISKSIESQLSGAGIWNTRTQSGAVKIGKAFMQLCRKGTPDRIFVDGVHVWIEVKRPDEVPTDVQAATHESLRENGALVFVLDDPADLRFVLEGLKRNRAEIALVKATIADIQRNIEAEIAGSKTK